MHDTRNEAPTAMTHGAADTTCPPTSPLSPSLLRYALAAVASLASHAIIATPNTPEYQYLLPHLQAVTAGGTGWAATLSASLARPAPIDEPLLRLAHAYGLTTFELLAVALSAAVEEDVMVGRVLAHVQAPLGGSRPTLGLLAAALGETVGPHPLDVLLTGAAVRSGMLTIIGDGIPLPERTVSVPIHLGLALRGQDGAVPGTTLGLGGMPAVSLPPSIRLEAERQARGVGASSARVLVLRTSSVAEGRAVAATIAQTLDCRPLFIETRDMAGLSPWLVLRRLLPVFCHELAPGEHLVLPTLPCYQGPMLALCGPDGSVEAAGGTALSWVIPVPPRHERQSLWEGVLGNHDLAATLARYYRHGSGRIAHLSRLARQQSVLQERAQPTAEDVRAASWAEEGSGLGALAQPLPDVIPEEALVTGATLRQQLHTLLLRCRARDGLVEGLGVSAAARYRPGVRALFVGPSGTGKTLAAGWLATQLGLPLYRVDLAAISSKYIGETEKNLAQLLARAEHAEVVLLFDEADSLFGKRTDVQQANDRFANAQTNYLLQRIESFDGITILTSNSRNRFDQAFSRRLDLVIDFPMPGPDERRGLWQSHLGQHRGLASQDINRLAALADLTGGQIRNVVLAAAVLAQAEDRVIGYDDIRQGLASEYRKLGKQVPVELMRDD